MMLITLTESVQCQASFTGFEPHAWISRHTDVGNGPETRQEKVKKCTDPGR